MAVVFPTKDGVLSAADVPEVVEEVTPEASDGEWLTATRKKPAMMRGSADMEGGGTPATAIFGGATQSEVKVRSVHFGVWA